MKETFKEKLRRKSAEILAKAYMKTHHDSKSAQLQVLLAQLENEKKKEKKVKDVK